MFDDNQILPVHDEELETGNRAKPQVRYSHIYHDRIGVGRGVLLTPVDHPRGRLNGRRVFTSVVVSCNADTGIIETQNTMYFPQIGAVKRPYFEIE